MRTLLATLHSKFIHNSLALPYLAASCSRDCGDMLIREFTVHEPKDSILAQLLAEQPDVLAFSVYLWNRRETLELVDALAAARPELQIVLGGPDVSFDDHGLFQRHPGLTALVHGEGELPLRALLTAWQAESSPLDIPRLTLRTAHGVVRGADGPLLADLDQIPSPFQQGWVDTSRGFVYYETSRGCPFRCSFCLSARDNPVRSFSMQRIRQDLRWLMEREVPKIRLVDRTFNYDAARARAIFEYILAHNRCSHFHFEIAAHLLDPPTLAWLETVPPGMFQFEIGVQSTRDQTLETIERKVNLNHLAHNIRQLRQAGRIELHLDLVAGLPGENAADFLDSIDRVAALHPDHLQIEPVKLLPGSALRDQASQRGIRFDPNPPYTILGSPELSFAELQHIKDISRLLDLTWNAGCLTTYLALLAARFASLARGLAALAADWQTRQLFRYPGSRQTLFEECWHYAQTHPEPWRQRMKDALAYDYARCERVIRQRLPAFFETGLSDAETSWVDAQIADKIRQIKGQGLKLQYFAAVFQSLPGSPERSVRLFLYLTRTGEKMVVEELVCHDANSPPQEGRTENRLPGHSTPCADTSFELRRDPHGGAADRN